MSKENIITEVDFSNKERTLKIGCFEANTRSQGDIHHLNWRHAYIKTNYCPLKEMEMLSSMIDLTCHIITLRFRN